MPITTARQQATKDEVRKAERAIATGLAAIRVMLEEHDALDRTTLEERVLFEVTLMETTMRDVGSRLWMEAHLIADRAAEMAAREIEESIVGFDLEEVDQRRNGVNLVLDELERLGVADEIAGVSPVDDAARTIRRTHG